MNHRETQGAKTIRESFYGCKLMDGTKKEWQVADGRNPFLDQLFVC
jgi:hypothetical protein